MIKEESAMKKRNNESGPPRRKYNPFEQDNLYLFPLARTFVDDEIKQPMDEKINKTKVLDFDQEEAKDYPFVFSIPVYNNIRTI